MNDELKLEQLFQSYRLACPEVEPGANFMPEIWRRIESKHAFSFVFRSLAKTTVTICAALCLVLAVLNFAPPFNDGTVQAPNYADALMAEHNAENTDFTENIHNAAVDEDMPTVRNR